MLLDNPYVFQDFRHHNNGTLSEEEWKRRRAGTKTATHAAVLNHDMVTVLSIVLSHVYTLRDCVNLIGQLVPLVIEIIMDDPGTLWSDACYLVVK